MEGKVLKIALLYREVWQCAENMKILLASLHNRSDVFAGFPKTRLCELQSPDPCLKILFTKT